MATLRAFFAAAFLLAAALSVGAGGARACDIGDAKLSTAWTTWLQCAHPLCGHARRLTAPPEVPRCDVPSELFADVSAVLRSGGVALIGEVHDNGRQHGLRAELLSEIVRVWRLKPGVVFEHIRADQQKGLDEFATFNAEARRLGTAGDLFRFLDWGHSGWPDQKLFAPLFETVIRAKLPVYVGDPARADIKRVAREGEAGLAEGDAARLGLDTPLAPTAQEGLLDELEASHCGLMPKTAFGNLAYAQRYRDATLADGVLQATGEHGSAILLAGNGHVRADRGVPWYIHQRAPDKKIVTVMLLEVEDGKTKPEDYDLKGSDGKPIADFVVFTPRAERPDPCEEMRQAFAKRAGKTGPPTTGAAPPATSPAPAPPTPQGR